VKITGCCRLQEAEARARYNLSMTTDERAQLIEDIKRSSKMRHDIAERAGLSEDFDIAAAWEVLAELDDSIGEGIMKARLKE
jgi:hypothetical protein